MIDSVNERKEGRDMKRKAVFTDAYAMAVLDAAKVLYQGGMNGALPHIKDAMILNMDAPEPHNLLGILAEMSGDDSRARKHYRAAYALDPTYQPACRNLERLVDFVWKTVSRKYDYGVEFQEANQFQADTTDLGREDADAVSH